jgi:hypothetical protein
MGEREKDKEREQKIAHDDMWDFFSRLSRICHGLQIFWRAIITLFSWRKSSHPLMPHISSTLTTVICPNYFHE